MDPLWKRAAKAIRMHRSGVPRVHDRSSLARCAAEACRFIRNGGSDEIL